MELSDVARRVLGSLVEKAMATPQSYPLSVNALRAACNQTTGRDPVTDLSEADVEEGLRELSAQHLVRAAYARRSSTPRWEHLLGSHLEIGDDEVALLGVLLLRGPQTVGELRQRTDRMHRFADLPAVQSALESLAAHPYGALAEALPRQPGQKEVRWRHLLGGAAPAPDAAGAPPAAAAPAGGRGPAADVAAVPAEVAALRDEVTALREEVAALRREVAALAGGDPAVDVRA